MVICELFSFALECDIPNWLTMAIELAIGGAVATLFFIRQQKQGARLHNVIDKQEKIIKEQEQDRKRRHDWASHSLRSYLPELKKTIKELQNEVSKYNVIDKHSDEALMLEMKIDAIELQKNYYLDKIDTITDQSFGFIDPSILTDIHDDIVKWGRRRYKEVGEGIIRYYFVDYKRIMQSIDVVLTKLPNPPI